MYSYLVRIILKAIFAFMKFIEFMKKMKNHGFMPKNSKIEIIFIASILSCLFWWRHMFGLTTFPYDYEFYHFPHWKYIYDSIASASFPFYDPYVYSGMPYLEETGSMLF